MKYDICLSAHGIKADSAEEAADKFARHFGLNSGSVAVQPTGANVVVVEWSRGDGELNSPQIRRLYDDEVFCAQIVILDRGIGEYITEVKG